MNATARGSAAIDNAPDLTGIDPALVERFRHDLERVLPEGGRLGLAVSGGPDSMAMLLLAKAQPDCNFEVATVDHGLREEAKEECALVAEACEALGVRCALLSIDVAKGNLQEQARAARYAVLGKWASENGISAIATAHHADDQAETILMRLNRGSGIAGLSGIRRRTDIEGCDVPVIRPLLDFRRDELKGVIEASGVETADDPSNRDDSFERVRIRKALATAEWLDPTAMARSAQHLAETADYLSGPLGEAWQANVVPTQGGFSYYPGNSPFENVELLAMILRQMGAEPRKSEIARMARRLWEGRSASLGGILAQASSDPAGLGVDGRRWDFQPEPPRRTS